MTNQPPHTGAANEDRRRAYDPEQRRRQPARAARTTGYRHDAERHEAARELVPAERRREIAASGGAARAATYHTSRPAPRDRYPPPIAVPKKQPRPAPQPAQPPQPAAPTPDREDLWAVVSTRLTKDKRAAETNKRTAAAARAAASRPARRAAAKAAAAKRQQP